MIDDGNDGLDVSAAVFFCEVVVLSQNRAEAKTPIFQIKLSEMRALGAGRGLSR